MDAQPSPYNPDHTFSWEDCKSLIESGNIHWLGRRPSQIDEYRNWFQETMAVYATPDDYILHVIFGQEVVEHTVGGGGSDRAGGSNAQCPMDL
jgi:hypothetical protein